MKQLNGRTRTIIAMAAIVISTGFAADAPLRAPRYRYVQLNVPGSRRHTTVPTGINNNNVIVGYYTGLIGCCVLTLGFSYDIQSGIYTAPIKDPSQPFGNTMPFSINDSGTIVGEIAGQGDFGFIDQAGSFTDVNTCGGNLPDSWITGMNNNLRTIGSCYNYQAWFNDLFGAQFFTCPSSGANTFATAINNNEQVVGYSQYPSIDYTGFVSSYGTCQTVGINYPGAASTMLTGINDSGTAIGWTSYAKNSSEGFAMLYDISNGNMTPLIGPKGASEVSTGQINNNGWFVGTYYDSENHLHGFYAEPAK